MAARRQTAAANVDAAATPRHHFSDGPLSAYLIEGDDTVHVEPDE